MISWIHFGDLHISRQDDQNYRDFLDLLDEAERHMVAGIAFALLPGDNADDGAEDEYELVRSAVSRSRFPCTPYPATMTLPPGASASFAVICLIRPIAA